MAQTEISNAILELRGSLTQDAFAAQAGISRTSVAHFENGSRPPDPQSLVALARTACENGRHDLAETFVRALPGVSEGLLKPAWEEFVDPRKYPKWAFHRTLAPVIVNSPREERALGPEWSRTPFPRYGD